MSDADFDRSALEKFFDSPKITVAQKQRFDGFRILGEIGRGAVGVVYKVHDTGLDRMIAIKEMEKCFLPETEAVRFQDEGKIIAKFDHANIVKVVDLIDVEEAYLLIMLYIEGVTLDEYISQRSLSWMQIAEITKQICSAIEHAHRKDVIHRDLKPSNVMVEEKTSGLEVKVMDFGLAKVGDKSEATNTTSAIMGTPLYMSPEQAQGKSDVDNRTDLYSIGTILYEMLCGQVCFAAKTSFALIMKIVKEDPIPPRQHNNNIPEELERICLKSLTKDKAQRYQSASEMIKELEVYIKKAKEYHKPVVIEQPPKEDIIRSSQTISIKKRRRSKQRYRPHTTRRQKAYTPQTGTAFSQSQLSNTHTKKMKATLVRKARKKRKSVIGWFEISSIFIILIILFLSMKLLGD